MQRVSNPPVALSLGVSNSRGIVDYASALYAITSDPRYHGNLDWGEPRRGHPEGTVRAHIVELERNLKRLRRRLSAGDCDKLRLLIHVHDTFKPEAKSGVPIIDSRSHASLAKAFLAEFCDDADLLAMVQYHDEPYALWQQVRNKGTYNPDRLAALIDAIRDWNLFLAFLIVDGCTEGKDRGSLHWFFGEVAGKVTAEISACDILE